MLYLGIVGEVGDHDDELFIWTHKKIDVGYNGDQVWFIVDFM